MSPALPELRLEVSTPRGVAERRRTVRKIRAVLLSRLGWSTREIAELLAYSQKQVSDDVNSDISTHLTEDLLRDALEGLPEDNGELAEEEGLIERRETFVDTKGREQPRWHASPTKGDDQKVQSSPGESRDPKQTTVDEQIEAAKGVDGASRRGNGGRPLRGWSSCAVRSSARARATLQEKRPL